MRFGFLNNFEATVVGELTTGATSMPINSGGERFADASTTWSYALVLAERDIRGRDLRREIVYVTGRADNTLTVVRGREGTAAQSWPTGTPVEARLTAGQLASLSGPEQTLPEGLTYLQPVAIRSALLNLLDAGGAVTVAVPSGYRLFLEGIDLVVAQASDAGGSPEIQAGPSSGSPDTYLSSTPVSVTAVGQRDVYTPLVDDGLTAVRVSVSVVGTGTTYQARVLLRGYLMEL